MPYQDFLGEGGTGVAPAKPYDPNDEPNPANPGGISNNQLSRMRGDATRAAATGTQRAFDPTVSAAASQAAAKTDPTTQAQLANKPKTQGVLGSLGGAVKAGTNWVGNIPGVGTAAQIVASPVGFVGGALAKKTFNALDDKFTNNASTTGGPAPTGSTKPMLGAAGPQPPAPGGAPTTGGTGANNVPIIPTTGAGGAPAAAGAAPAWSPTSADTSAFDAGTQAIQQAQAVFQSELSRLSGVDPFGNQAFMQKATDRAVSQAAGTAAGVRGGAAAQAGAGERAVGVQAQTAARGVQDVAQQRSTDQNTASAQRLAAAGGIMSGAQAIAENQGKKADAYLKASELNLRGYLGGRELDQRETESLRNVALEVAKIDQARYATDTEYRASVNANLTSMYNADTALQGLKYQVDAGENLSADEWLMGLVGAGAGVASGVAMKSDRRSKYAVRAPKLAELREYLGASPGAHYRYRTPSAPGQRAGENFGPMAQDLLRSRIGRTVVVEKADGYYVDTGRLALADHGALSALAARVERLAAKTSRKGSAK